MKSNPTTHSAFVHLRVGLSILLGSAALLLTFGAIAQAQRAVDQKNGFPALRDQLAQEYLGRKVESGTALEELIRRNQDFTMLSGDEKNDSHRLPPWLRAWWRKAHPELKYSADDPTGGYPLVLKEILEWMMTHQDLKAGPGDAKAEEREHEEDATAGPDMRISGAQSSSRSESDVRINYFDQTKVISASNNISASGQQAIAYSTNSGASWSQALLPLTSPDSYHSDPTVDWTSDSRAFSATLGISGSTLRMRTYFSADNGASWTLDGTPSGTQTSVDKEMTWVDHSGSSPYKDQIYAIWHNGNPAFMNRRTAGAGGTWLASPIQVSGAETSGTAIGGDVKTNSVGDVFGAWPATGNRGLFVVKSTNGGASFGTPVLVATTYDSYDIGVPSFNSRRALIYVTLGTYHTASRDNVYLLWTDLSGESGCTSAGSEPGSNVAATCKTRIWFSRSTNGGATWSPAIKINNQASLNDQYNPWMAVDETSGGIGVIYYDTVSDAGRKKSDIWYQSSADEGITWSTPIKVTTGMTDETGSGADSGNQYGDYNGLTAFASTFFPSWTDRRNGAKEEIWTSKITDTFTPSAVIVSGTSGVNDGRVAPAHFVTVNLCVQNVGSLNATNVVGTLQATGGVTNPSGAQSYGAMTAGGPAVCRAFSFNVDPNLACGSNATLTLALQDGATSFTPAVYNFPTGVFVSNFSEKFDGVTAPVLPAGWAASNASGAALWVTTTTNADTAPNCAYIDDPTSVSDKRLDSPPIAITSSNARVSFRNYYNLEGGSSSFYDGGVLEISSPNINGGAFTDITNAAVGGSFISGGYSGTISSSYSNPLAGRQAWSGNSGGYVNTVATLGPNVAGQTIKLRFRLGTDTSATASGWWIDGVTINYPSCDDLKVLSVVRQPGNHFVVQALGFPSATHTVEASSDPNPAHFSAINTATADSSGVVQYDDAVPAGTTARFYRIRYP